jgi:lysozyme family protein
MADFDKAHAKTMGNEGGFAHNPADAGGMTYKGIAREFWPTWQGWRGIDAALGNMVKMPRYGTEECRNWVKHLNSTLAGMPLLQKYVLDFYEANFWKAYSLGEIQNQEVAEWLYDHTVNAAARGVKWIQEAAGVTPDGGVGPITLAAINAADPKDLLEKAKGIAVAYRLAKVEKDPTQKQFLHSWLSRDGLTEEEIKAAIATV